MNIEKIRQLLNEFSDQLIELSESEKSQVINEFINEKFDSSISDQNLDFLEININLKQRIGWLSERIILSEQDRDYIKFQMKDLVYEVVKQVGNIK